MRTRVATGLVLFLSAATFSVPERAPAAPLADPLRFFEGRTESSGVMKLVLKRPYKVLSIGQGRIERDGSLHLVQQVRDEGQPPKERVWRIRQIAPGKFIGTMNEAKGPVTIEQVGDRYRFRFNMPGNLAVEQWVKPDSDGRSASITLTIRKLGIKVGSSDAKIRKL